MELQVVTRPRYQKESRAGAVLARQQRGEEHFSLIKQNGFSLKDLPLPIFSSEPVANWHQLRDTFAGLVPDTLHVLCQDQDDQLTVSPFSFLCL